MALKFFWRCEGTTLDGTHDYSAGDTTATLTSGAAINTDAARIGTNGLDCPTIGDYASFAISSGDLISQSVGALAFSFRLVAFLPSNSLFQAKNSANSSQITVQMIGTDDATGRELQFRIRLHGGIDKSVGTTAANLALNTWYAVVCRWDEPANDMRIEVYDAAGSLITAVEDLATNFDQPTGLDSLRIGETLNFGSSDFHIDNVFIADTYAEPLENFLDITSYTEYGASGAIPHHVFGKMFAGPFGGPI